MIIEWYQAMGHLFEISTVSGCRVFFERNRDSHHRDYYSAYVQFPTCDQIILDDRILPRLKQRLEEIMKFRDFWTVTSSPEKEEKGRYRFVAPSPPERNVWGMSQPALVTA